MPNFSCVFNKINKSKMRIIPKSTEVRDKLLQLLNDRKINFNTYTPHDDKMQNILLKETETEHVKTIEEALTRNSIIPHKIQRFETGYMRKNGIKSNIWQITLQPKTDTNAILNIRYIAEWSVKWEIMKKPQVTQCRRCQRFNHSSSNCSLPYRCVKCVSTHEPGKCSLDTNNNKVKPKCVNCLGEHTANNARIQKAARNKRTKETRKTEERSTTAHRYRVQ